MKQKTCAFGALEEYMSLARGVLLTEIARLEKCIEEKRASAGHSYKMAHKEDADIIEMSERVRELRAEIERMIVSNPPFTAWSGFSREFIPGGSKARFIGEIKNFRAKFLGCTFKDKDICAALREMLDTIHCCLHPATMTGFDRFPAGGCI